MAAGLVLLAAVPGVIFSKDTMNVKFLHKIAGAICAASILVALIASSFIEETALQTEFVAKIMLGALAVYSPFYCAYSNEKGEISAKGYLISKEKNPNMFRFVVAVNLLFAVIVLGIFIS